MFAVAASAGCLRTLVYASLLLAWWLVTVPPAAAQPVVYVVRHAEKQQGADDPPLTPAGRLRAERLAYFLGEAGIDAIYVTQFRRTRQTAAPLAQRLALEPIVVRAGHMSLLLKRLQTHADDEAVLVVGHSHTVPGILQELGYGGRVTLREQDYGDLFVLLPRADGSAVSLHLNY